MRSESVNIYVDSDEGMEVFARQIERAFGIQLSTNTNGKHKFVYTDGHQWLVIHQQDRNTAEFPYWIEVGSYSAKYADRLTYMDEFARLIYEKLKATRKYRFLMLADPEVRISRAESAQRKAS